jgi:hypothetical protein
MPVGIRVSDERRPEEFEILPAIVGRVVRPAVGNSLRRAEEEVPNLAVADRTTAPEPGHIGSGYEPRLFKELTPGGVLGGFAVLDRPFDELYAGKWMAKNQDLGASSDRANDDRAGLFNEDPIAQYLRSNPTSRPCTLTRSGGKIRVS